MNANQIKIVGYIAEPKMKDTKKSKLVTFGLGFQDGMNKTSWIQVQAWNQLADLVLPLAKGTMVVVTGSLSINRFTTKEGQDVRNAVINLSEIKLCEQRMETHLLSAADTEDQSSKRNVA